MQRDPAKMHSLAYTALLTFHSFLSYAKTRGRIHIPYLAVNAAVTVIYDYDTLNEMLMLDKRDSKEDALHLGLNKTNPQLLD